MARIPDSFGARIQWRRRHFDMTQHQLAQKVGVREADIQRWEGDHNFPRDAWKIAAIANALETTENFLFGRTNDVQDGGVDLSGLDESYPKSTGRRRRRAPDKRRAT